MSCGICDDSILPHLILICISSIKCHLALVLVCETLIFSPLLLPIFPMDGRVGVHGLPTGFKVMVVDDDLQSLEVVEGRLLERGYVGKLLHENQVRGGSIKGLSVRCFACLCSFWFLPSSFQSILILSSQFFYSPEIFFLYNSDVRKLQVLVSNFASFSGSAAVLLQVKSLVILSLSIPFQFYLMF